MWREVLLMQLVILGNDAISLYDPNEDNVVELMDVNMTDLIYDSQALWIVEFYAHWCGHCQRFAPNWISLADRFKDWQDHVKIAAVNCAEQEICSKYFIRGTPTIRTFVPYTPSESVGVDIRVNQRQDVEYLFAQVARHLTRVQEQGLGKPGLENLKAFAPSQKGEINRVVDDNAADDRSSAFILESTDEPYIGARAILELGNQIDNFATRRIPNADAMESVTQLFPGVESAPAVVFTEGVDRVMEPKFQYFYPDYSSEISPASQMANFLLAVSGEEEGEIPTAPTSEVVESSIVNMTSGGRDVVYAGDIELAIEYALNTEIPAMGEITLEKMPTLYKFLDSLAQYAPVGEEIRDFTTSLREWPVKMAFNQLSGEQWEERVASLSDMYQPFEATPDDYVACLGSEPHLRGYPCSLWTTFHTMTVNAAVKESKALASGFRPNRTTFFEREEQNPVALAIVGYVSDFFSCRHCAENFLHKVARLGDLPTSSREAMIWLWKIHNMANVNLQGDPTEDPTAPKVLWPTKENCPDCRVPEEEYGVVFFAEANDDDDPRIPGLVSDWIEASGVYWKESAVADYLKKVYATENIVKNPRRAVGYEKESRLAEFRSLMTGLVDGIEVEMRSDEGETIRDMSIAKRINNYCASLFENYRNLNNT